MNGTPLRQNYILVLLAAVLLCLALFLPFNMLEYLSLEVVGEPPINGLTWMAGVEALGGPLSMGILTILEVVIIFIAIPIILKWEKKPIAKKAIHKAELLFFLIIFFS